MISSALYGDYRQNPAAFEEFYALQGDYAAALALQPASIRAWLDDRPRSVRSSDRGDGPCASQSWRTARLSSRRRRELSQLMDDPGARERLASWLRGCLPVLSLLEIGERVCADLAEMAPATLELGARLSARREQVFLANYGLAKAAAGRGRSDGFDDRLSAAGMGLLDAVDRYVPGAGAARFSYFAAYWIRYQIGRQAQKCAGVVAFPIHQQRMGRKLAQLALERQAQGLGEASQAEACAALAVGPDAYFRQRQRPTVVSIQAPPLAGEPEFGLEHVLRDPAPLPGSDCEERDLESRIHGWLCRSLPPATRVMLAYAHDVGSLPEAAKAYVEHLREIARERLRHVAE